VTWDGVLRLRGDSLEELTARHGGRVVAGGQRAPRAVASVDVAGDGDIAPLFSSRFAIAARIAIERGAALLVDREMAASVRGAPAIWEHEHAKWALASLLGEVSVESAAPVWGADCSIAATAVLGQRVVLGERVMIGPGCVIGHAGFGWALGAAHVVRAVPHLAGVVIESDVSLGPLCTVDAGTLSPTRVRRGAKLDAQVHVGHNADIGEGTLVAAQCGLAGSVKLGRRVLVGGQVGIADHVVVGDGARIAAKSGVIGDVPAGATVAGYPAVARMRWLRALAKLYALSGSGK
jgi:UDP-3-O-[3-hydroxymyristoyl] glucosamine N-acyltransferase